MGRYVVEDRNGEVLYTAEAKDTITDRDILSIYNDKHEKVASVKEHLISVGIPVIEKDVKKLKALYREGYEDAAACYEELMKYLKEE